MSHEIKVISLVPSWTETLIEAGVQVVGRTRFCIHPEHIVQNIPVVGGTKSIDMDACLSLDADFILFDREENTADMVKQCEEAGFRWIATHVTDLKSCAEELNQLAELLKNDKLKKWSEDYQEICEKIKTQFTDKELLLRLLIIQSGLRFFDNKLFDDNSPVSYVIWKQPYMIVTRETFIGDVLSILGIELVSCQNYMGNKYPVIEEAKLRNTNCLFSSEPFPFEKYVQALIDQKYSGILVDGELLSWYGIRNLKFLFRVTS